MNLRKLDVRLKMYQISASFDTWMNTEVRLHDAPEEYRKTRSPG